MSQRLDYNTKGQLIEVTVCDNKKCRADITEEFLQRPAHGADEGGVWCITCYNVWYAPAEEWKASRGAREWGYDTTMDPISPDFDIRSWELASAAV